MWMWACTGLWGLWFDGDILGPLGGGGGGKAQKVF